ncbi:beta-ketoacyl synthase N-terminal-like domain-containing protein [Streptomyces rhizosphaericus]|uniref:beta-ketoacyl synthase N-terminal-like domain-containing protein n=1 Tax=Streptomyces rhizosphaericus TaxID=114699 RepID=UPI000A39168F|nr:beta-ketoacyl synthase N-terminal-like domain-containing protein [Streptomyces rhizosphaericus]
MSTYAIVGLSCLFPGARTPAEFWHNLRAGADSRREGGQEVFGTSPEEQDLDPQHEIYCRRGGFVTGFDFDPGGYRLDPGHLARLDRLFHWSLHVTREALRDSGHAERPGVLARAGLVLGNYSFPTPTSAKMSVPLAQEAVLEGLRRAGLPELAGLPPGAPLVDEAPLTEENLRVSGSPAGVTATALGLGGPRYALDAACSSALYALKLACDHLATGQADLMLAGGVCAPDPTLIHLSFSDLGAYPRDGFSQPFDRRSGGILTGQGAGMVAVRRLADAVRDGDKIYAVVEGIGLTNDGGGRHLLVPQGQGQLDAYELAYKDAEFGPEEVDYVECHATGTPIGDATEAESVARFFGGAGKVPLLGSVKGNIGHLLTVAGLSSLLKVIVAMGEGHLPPTIAVGQPIESQDGTVGASVLVREGRPWPDHGGPRRAAVSAFGFGGTNAHVVLSDTPPQSEAEELQVQAVPALDIIGLGSHFGSLDGVEEFEQVVHSGADAFAPLPERRWRGLEQTSGGSLERRAGVTPDALPQGVFVDGVAIDPVDQKIPPADLRTYNVQHVLATKVADEALRDAGYSREVSQGAKAPASRRIAVVVAMETEPYSHARLTRYRLATFLRESYERAGLKLTEEQRAALAAAARDAVVDPITANEVLSYIGNIMASRISSLWNLTGPSFTLSSEGSGTVAALETARLLLLDPTIEAVLVGAVDMTGSAEQTLLAPETAAQAGLTFGEDMRGRRIGEGAGAVVVTRPDEAHRATDRVYARLESLAVRHAAPAAGAVPTADVDTLARAAEAALAEAGIVAAGIEYVEAHAGGTADLDRAEVAALARTYPGRDGERGTALGSAAAQVGTAGCAGAMAGLLRTVLCLHHGYLPGTKGWRRPAADLADAFAASALYVPEASRPWLRRAQGVRRHAAVNVLGSGGMCGHLVLSADATRGAVARTDWRRAGGPALLPLAADSLDGLLAEIERHRTLLGDGGAGAIDPYALAREAAGRLRRFPASAPRAVFVGTDAVELRAQLNLAVKGVADAYARGGEWATPAGTFFTARPIGPDGKVALVYPGAFNSYPGLGQDFFRAFPGLLDRFEAQAAEPARLLRAHRLYPRTHVTPERRDVMKLEAAMGEDVPFMLATGTSFAILHTDLVRETLGLKVHGGFGYSLGESSMLHATGGWRQEGRRDDLLSNTPIFRDRLCGARRTVRELWRLPRETRDDAIWASYVLLTDADLVVTALAGYDRVYLTHVNTPGELVIAGDPVQCRALVEELGCPAARSPVSVVMHCTAVDSELEGLAGLNDYPTGPVDGLELLSAYDYEALTRADGGVVASGGSLDRTEVARRIAQTLRSPIDFPRLVRTAYDRGFRYFIEVGPSATCSRWVRDTLGDAPHVAVPVDRRGVPATRSVAQLLARLVGHGLDVDLEAPLAAPPPRPGQGRAARFRVGGGTPVPDRIARSVRELATSDGPFAARRPAPVPVAPEEPARMPADLTLAEETIAFDGEPISVLPFAPTAPRAVPAAPEPLATVTATPPSQSRVEVASASVAHAREASAAADVVRELRGQMLATHSVVMETQYVLQLAALRTTEALLDGAAGAPIVPSASAGPSAPVQRPASAAAEPLRTAEAAPGAQAQALPAAPSSYQHQPAPVDEGTVRPASERTAGDRTRPDGVVWDNKDLLEFATGRVANVFGPEFAVIDEYAKRVRLPAPPYHFVTRVTRVEATPGELKPSKITTEFDVPEDAWYAVDGGVPPAVTVEAGQCDLLLVSYLGIDFRNKGERVYRLLDSSLIFHGPLPRTGQTLRYDISIDRFVHQGDTTLFFFSYLCYADGELILELKDACAGFFGKQELDTPLGVVMSEKEKAGRAARTALPKKTFKPLEYTDKDHLTPDDLELLAQGTPGEVFGPHHAQAPGINPALKLPVAELRMVDEVTIDRTGGPYGLGRLSAIKRLEPDAWYFECHFPDDPVLAGSLVAEGAVQLLQIYLLYLGMHLTLPDARFQTMTELRIDVQVRGQITPEHPEIRYEVEVTEVTLLPRPSVVADVLIHLGDKPVIRMRNLGLQILEKEGTPYRPEAGGIPAFLGRRNRSGEPAMINEMHLAHAAKGDLGMAMGPEFDIYRERRAPYIPNGDFKFVDRVMRLEGTRGDLSPGSEMVTEYDSAPDSWYYRENSFPHMPNCVYMESSLQAAIFLGYYLGATLKNPEQEYSIRNLGGRATLVKDIDLRGRTIRHHSRLLMTSAVQGAVLQNFSYELSADGEVFYTGESLFGYFSEAALANQVGLDNDAYVAPWLEQELPDSAGVRTIDLRGEDAPAFRDPSGGRLYLPGGHFALVDEVQLVVGGGRHGAGYLHGRRVIRPDEWYFDCHFHRDPVMPGSLGVEAVLQALRLFVIEEGLADGYARPRFAMATDVEMSWKYRGQILCHDGEMSFDAHVKEVRREDGRLLVIADAELWKPGLRIYELIDVAIEVRPDTDAAHV